MGFALLGAATDGGARVLAVASIYWHLPILIVVISLVYSATRFEHWNQILHEALRWGLRMTAFLLGIGIILLALATFV